MGSDYEPLFLTKKAHVRSVMRFASLYLIAFEMFRHNVEDSVRFMHWDGFDEQGDKYCAQYEEVRAKTRGKDAVNLLRASLEWCRKSEIITDEDLEAARGIVRLRNRLAHRLPQFVMSPDFRVERVRLSVLLRLSEKVGRWFTQVDIAWEDHRLTPEQFAAVVPGWVALLHYLDEMVKEWAEQDRLIPEEPETEPGPSTSGLSGTPPGTP